MLKIIILFLFVFIFLLSTFNMIDNYILLVMMYIGINVILTVSLNLVNGYMGEFSVGHAGFMAIGAYTASLITINMATNLSTFIFPIAITIGGVVASLAGLLVAIPSFKTRGDYLAIVTLAFLMIVKSSIENLDFLGSARGLLGMDKHTNLVWVFIWMIIALYIVRNLVYSNFGRAIQSIREDEIASTLVGVDTRKMKIIAFMVSSFFAGIAGGLLAHLIQYINPKMFDIVKSTEILVMVYLGGIGSIVGSIIGAVTYTLLLEILRPLEIWRMVIMPLMLVFLMLFKPKGIMGLKEWSVFIPKSERKEK